MSKPGNDFVCIRIKLCISVYKEAAAIKQVEFYLRKVAQGVAMSAVAVGILFAVSDNALVDRFIINQTMPNYNMRDSMQSMLRFINIQPLVNAAQEQDHAVQVGGRLVQLHDVSLTGGLPPILGVGDIIFRYDTASYLGIDDHFTSVFHTIDDIAEFRDFNRLRNNFYTVDQRTRMTPDLFNVDTFMAEELRISKPSVSGKPQILIFHTHAHEMFADSRDINEGIMAVGAELARVLELRHGIRALHVTEIFDYERAGAYERMEPHIRQILAENPSIEVVIDLHRDGVPEDRRLVTTINGRPTAQIMFFNGLSRRYRDGVLAEIYHLPNPYLHTNLAFSFRMQLAANAMHPGIARKIYLNAFRYSLHMMPKSLFVEVGAQTNTLEEALNAALPLADILATVILP